MEKVLLHSCCAPCSAAILEWMGQNGYEPTILFYNPNIFPEEEYLKRKNEIVRYAKEIGVAIVDLDGSNTGDNAGGPWEQQHAQWLECTVGLEDEPERGGRCLACFRHRLCTAASYAADHGFPLFTTLQPAVLRLRVQPRPPHCAPKQLLTFRQAIKQSINLYTFDYKRIIKISLALWSTAEYGC